MAICSRRSAAAYLIYKNWDKIKAWWNSWTLADLFAPVKEFARDAQAYVIEKWKDLKAWWDSWSFADVFAPVKGYAYEAWGYVSQMWNDFAT